MYVCVHSCVYVCVCVPVCLLPQDTQQSVSRAHRFMSHTLLGPACIEKKQSDASDEVICMKTLPLSGTLKPHPRTCRDVWIVARPPPAHDANPHHTQRPQHAPHGVMSCPTTRFCPAENQTRPSIQLPWSCRPHHRPTRARTCYHRCPTLYRSPPVCLAELWPDPHATSPLSLTLRPMTIATTESQSRWANHSVRLISHHIDQIAMYIL